MKERALPETSLMRKRQLRKHTVPDRAMRKHKVRKSRSAETHSAERWRSHNYINSIRRQSIKNIHVMNVPSCEVGGPYFCWTAKPELLSMSLVETEDDVKLPYLINDNLNGDSRNVVLTEKLESHNG